jgi:hypothetical protein
MARSCAAGARVRGGKGGLALPFCRAPRVSAAVSRLRCLRPRVAFLAMTPSCCLSVAPRIHPANSGSQRWWGVLGSAKGRGWRGCHVVVVKPLPPFSLCWMSSLAPRIRPVSSGSQRWWGVLVSEGWHVVVSVSASYAVRLVGVGVGDGVVPNPVVVVCTLYPPCEQLLAAVVWGARPGGWAWVAVVACGPSCVCLGRFVRLLLSIGGSHHWRWSPIVTWGHSSWLGVVSGGWAGGGW